MGKYKQPPAHARHTGGMTAHYLEAVEAESDYEDDGLTASDRARRSLHRDRYDEEAEVSPTYLSYSAYAISLLSVKRGHVNSLLHDQKSCLGYNGITSVTM